MKLHAELLGSMLYKARNKMGYSQFYMAQKIGISQKTYSYFESGRRTPDLIKFLKIAYLTEINPIELMEKLFEGFPAWESHKTKEQNLNCEIEKLNSEITYLRSYISFQEKTINNKLDKILESRESLISSQ